MDKTGKNGNECPHPIDEIFRKGLQDYREEPPERAWGSINRKLLWGEILRLNFRNVPGIAWITAASAVVLLAVIWFLLSPASSLQVPVAKKEINAENPKTGSPVVPAVTHTLTAHRNAAVSAAHQVYASTSKRVIPERTVLPGQTAANESVTKKEEVPEENILTPAPLLTRNSGQLAPPISALPGYSAFTVNMSNSPEAKNETPPFVIRHVSNVPPQEQILTAKSLTPFPIHFAVGIDAEPDITFYKSNHSYSYGSYSGGLNLQFHFGRFFFRTGASLGYFADQGQYLSEYTTPDSVATLKPADSVVHSTTAVTTDHYLYLQVPMLLGFKAFESNHFRFSFQAGPAVSFLLQKDEPLPNPSYPGGTVTKLVRQTPERMLSYWQLWAGFSLEYLFNRNLSICIEPGYKYSLTPVTTSGELPANHSQSVGINVGFRYSFGYNYKDK
ncbi:MAG TPA: outer membrane beta-barrel protein [Bacteroidales bacterium]|nr:outer membrane beta-barrel protein [Bacteroidales bacterium]